MSERMLGPTLLKCSICNKDYGVAIPTLITPEVKEHWSDSRPSITNGICDDCQKIIDENITVQICLSDGTPTGDNYVIKKDSDFIKNLDSNIKKEVLKNKGMKMTRKMWNILLI